MTWWLTLPLIWTVRVGSVVLLVGTLLPLLRSGRWFIRGWEGPRLQWAALAGVLLLGWTAAVVWLDAEGFGSIEPWLWPALLGAVIVVQLGYAARYLPPWPNQMRGSPEPWRATDAARLKLVASNLDMRNPRHAEAVRVLGDADADVLLLIELHEAWRDGLSPLRSRYPHRVEHVAEDGLGLAVWSKLELRDAAVKFLVHDDRASVHADVVLRDGRRVRLRGVHPAPPGLRVGRWADRLDSRMRDAELLMVAREVAEDPEAKWVIAGDFNDVAWSRTTRQFEKLSGLKDPRVGRTLLNTYDARTWWLRFPLDHVYASADFTVGQLRRLRLPGSDHFAVLAELRLEPLRPGDPQKQPQANGDDEREADQIIVEGQRDAAKTDTTAGDPA